jgi:hypothetical protein
MVFKKHYNWEFSFKEFNDIWTNKYLWTLRFGYWSINKVNKYFDEF